jgi:hypothetical protein
MFLVAFFAAWITSQFFQYALLASIKGPIGTARASQQPAWRRILLNLLMGITTLAVISLCAAPFFVFSFFPALGTVVLAFALGSLFAGITTAAMQRGWPFKQGHISYAFFPVAPFVGLLALLLTALVWTSVAARSG